MPQLLASDMRMELDRAKTEDKAAEEEHLQAGRKKRAVEKAARGGLDQGRIGQTAGCPENGAEGGRQGRISGCRYCREGSERGRAGCSGAQGQKGTCCSLSTRGKGASQGR